MWVIKRSLILEVGPRKFWVGWMNREERRGTLSENTGEQVGPWQVASTLRGIKKPSGRYRCRCRCSTYCRGPSNAEIQTHSMKCHCSKIIYYYQIVFIFTLWPLYSSCSCHFSLKWILRENLLFAFLKKNFFKCCDIILRTNAEFFDAKYNFGVTFDVTAFYYFSYRFYYCVHIIQSSWRVRILNFLILVTYLLTLSGFHWTGK